MLILIAETSTSSPSTSNSTAELIKILPALAWALIFLIIFCSLRKQLEKLLQNSTSIEIKMLGSEVKFTGKPSELRDIDINKIIQPIVQAIDKNIINLSSEEKKLLQEIDSDISTKKEHKLPDRFERNSELHEIYRSLRQRHLIKPKEGGLFERPGQEVEITDFGRAVLDLKKNEIFSEK